MEVKENTAAWKVYTILRERIINGYYPHTHAFVEQTLVDELGVSRTPIRTAFQQLKDDGLIELVPGKGAYLRKVGVDEVEDIFTIREALEGISARCAAKVISHANTEIMWDCYNKSRLFLQQGDVHAFSAAGKEIHKMILKMTKNEYLMDIVTKIDFPTKRFQESAIIVPGRSEQSCREHYEIVRAISDHDEDMAEKKMREHIVSTKHSLILALKNEI